MPRIVIFDSRTAITSFEISPCKRVMPADSIATSVPVAIAMPHRPARAPVRRSRRRRHGDHAARRLQLLYLIELIFGQYLRNDLVDAD